MSANVESMMYVRETPWYGLGIRLGIKANPDLHYGTRRSPWNGSIYANPGYGCECQIHR